MATPWPLDFSQAAAPASALPLPACPLVIFVGLTGVGKSTLLSALEAPLLPNRRDVVDRYVLPLLGAEATVDREKRFELTRRYRELHSGGLAHALAQGWVEPTWPLLFDGLRGEEELDYALRHFPLARYVVLEARDLTRLARLLGRGDAFDRVSSAPAGERSTGVRELAESLFTRAEVEQVLSWEVPEEELMAKLTIIASERRSYAPEGARRVLAGCPDALFIDTERCGPGETAEQVRRFLLQASHFDRILLRQRSSASTPRAS